MFPSTLTSFSLPCVTKDIQNFVLRKHKYIRAVNQFNEDEPLPSNLLFPFFKKLKDTKQLKAFNFKWSHFPGLQTKPEIVKSVFKRHCQYIHKHNVLATDMAFPKHHKNLIVPLKNVTIASLDNSKDIRKLMTLKTVENLTIDLRYGKIDYKVLYHTLYRLAKLKNLIVVTPQKSLEQTLMVLHELTFRRPEIEFQIFVGGKQDQHDIPYLATPLVEKVTQMSYQNINPALLLDNLFFQERSFVFTGLKVLRLEFNNMTPQATSYLSYIKEVSGLEDFTLKIVDCHDSNVAAGIIKGLRLPSSLQTLELNIPLHFSSLLTHTKRLVNKVSAPKKGYYPWRTRNIFEEELLFASFLENFTEAQNLRRITFDFQMLEDFHSHYTNFIISILGRLLNLVFLEIQVTKIQQDDMEATQSLGCFDLSPFFKVCSQMPQIEQIEILMPNLLFDGANFTPITPNLKNFTIGVDEADEDKPIKFFNISKSVDKLMKTLMKCSPNLVNLGLDFSETVTQATLLKRFYMIQKFQRLEALGARYFVGDCSQETVRQVGIVVKSLSRLNMLLLKFLETEKKIYGIQNYIKYHQSLRNMMIQFNDSAWMDNECLINPLGAQIKETKIDTEEDENDVDNMNMQGGSLNELIPMDLMQETN